MGDLDVSNEEGYKVQLVTKYMQSVLVRCATSDFDKRPCDRLYPFL